MYKYYRYLFSIILFLSISLQAQIQTKFAAHMNEDKFGISYYMSQFLGATNDRFVKKYVLITKVGLTKRVEFVGHLPFYKVTEFGDTLSVVGDLIIDLKFQLRKGWYQLPLIQTNDDSRYYFNLYLGFNTATGPDKDEYDSMFYPYNIGLGDFRWGFLFGSIIDDFEYYLNLIYVYASYKGETFFPVSKDIWNMNSDPKVVFFNVHRIFLKFLWPGEAYGEVPMRDDYIMYNINLAYWIDFRPIIFKYKFFAELSGLQNFNSKYCLRKNRVDFTAGVTARIFRGGKVIMGFTYPFITYDFYGIKFFFGVNFFL